MEILKKKRGRPTKYTPEFLKNLGDKLILWIKEPTHWWLMDFAIENNLWDSQLDELAHKNEYFSESLKKAKTIQKSRIVQLAMARKIDNAMAIFTLKNIAGWRDKQPEEYDKTQTVIIINHPQKANNDSSPGIYGDRTPLANSSAN